mmetsp:Transcript_36039/g.72539  ORF Transcript_36039/g.72539 Transcript_36039/m.72539 type:complete len:288 (-) Transcript_36039:51-914(-)
MEAKVEKFLLENPGLDERAVKALKSASPEIQSNVLERGSLVDCNNPTAVLISRIRRESETSLSGVSKADLYGSPEEAWARICARNNIRAPTPQASGAAQPALLAILQQQQQQQQQQQLAAQQHAAAWHALQMQQLAPLQQLASMQALTAPQLPLTAQAQLGGITLAPPAVPAAPALAMPAAASSLGLPPAPLPLNIVGMQQLTAPPPLAAAPPPLAAMWQQNTPPLAAAPQESGPGGAVAGAADAVAQLTAGFAPAAAAGSAADAAPAPPAPTGGVGGAGAAACLQP